MRLSHTAVAATTALFACSVLAATTTFQTESFGNNLQPIQLFNDGQMLTYGPSSYSPNTCPPPERPDQTYCPPVTLVKTTLALATVAGGYTVLPFNTMNSGYRFQPNGQGIIWSGYEGLTLQSADVYTGTLAPFAPGVASPWASCTGIEPPTQYLWQSYIKTGKLVGQNTACTNVDSVYFFSATGTQEVVAPAGYTGVRLNAVNNSEQLAVTATQAANSTVTKAFAWTQKSGYKALPVPLWSWLQGYTNSQAIATDDAGDILGNIKKRDGSTHAVIWQAGKPVDIGTLSGYRSSAAVGLSSNGVALVCAYNDTSGTGTTGASTLFLWVNGTKLNWNSATTAKDEKPAPSDCTGVFSVGIEAPHFWPNDKGQWLIQNSAGTYLVSPIN